MFNIDFNTNEQKIDSLVAKLGKVGDASTEAAAKIRQAMQEVKALNAEAKSLTQIYTMASKSSKELAKSSGDVAEKTKKVAKGAKDAKSEVLKYSKSANVAAQETAAFRAALNASGASMGIFTSQTIITAATVYALVSSFKSMVNIGIEFTGEMTRAIPIMGATGKQAEMLENEVRRLGETTQFTATEAAGGLTALAMAGLSSSQAMNALEPTLNLSAIGMIDMYKSADILTNVMTGFRLEATDVAGITDDLATAITSSNSTIEQMANALSYVAPIAQAAGGSIEETTAMLEVFHNAGIKSSRAGTALRRAYSNLMNPTAEAAELLSELNVHTKDSSGNMLRLADIMNQLADNGASANDIISLFGVRAAPAMVALLNDMKGVNSQFEMFYQQLTNNDGAADELRKQMEENLGTDLRKLLSALQEQALAVFDHLEGGMRGAAQELTEFIRSFTEDDIKTVAEILKTIGTGVEQTAKGLLSLAKAANDITSVFGGVSGIFKVLADNMDLVVIALGALKAAGLIKFLGGGFIALDKDGYKAGRRINWISKAINGLGVAARANPIGLIIAGLGTASYVAYQYLKPAEEIVNVTREQNEELQKQVDLQAKLNKNNQLFFDSALAGESGEQDRYLKGFDKQEQDLIAKIKELGLQYGDVETFWESQINKDARKAIEYQKVSGEVKDRIISVIKDYNAQLEQLYKERQFYLDNGLTIQGAKDQKKLEQELIEYEKGDLEAIVKKAGADLKTSLGNLKSNLQNDKINISEFITGSSSEISSSSGSVLSQITAEVDALQSEFNKLKIDGVITDMAEYERVAKELIDAKKLLNETEQAYKEEIESVSQAFDKYINQIDSLQERGDKRADKLRSEIAVLKGESVAAEDSTVANLKLALARNEAAKASAGKGSEYYEQLEAESEQLRQQIATIKELTNTKELLTIANSGGISKSQELVEQYLEEVKALDARNQMGLEILEGYEQRKLDLKAEYMEKARELDEKRLKQEHEMWFQITDNAAEAIGENISQVALMDQSWQEAGKNIRRAIVGGMLQSLIEYGIKRAAIGLADILWNEQESLSALKTAGAIAAADSTRMASKLGTNQAIIASNTAVAASEAAATVGLSVPAQTTGVTLLMSFMTALLSSIGSGLGSGISGGREIGGPVQAGQSYVVGEKGPEIFRPTYSGSITSNADVNRRVAGENSGGGEIHHHYRTEHNTWEINAVDSKSFVQLYKENRHAVTSISHRTSKQQGRAR